METRKIKITERALTQRINRRLEDKKQILRKSRQDGKFFIVDLVRNAIHKTDVDINKLGKQLAVFEAWEEYKPE